MSVYDALPQEEIARKLQDLPDWKQDDKALVRVQTFPEYLDALDYVYKVGQAAEKANHHPDIVMNYSRVTVKYWTHKARGITDLDFKMAREVEGILKATYKPKPA